MPEAQVQGPSATGSGDHNFTSQKKQLISGCPANIALYRVELQDLPVGIEDGSAGLHRLFIGILTMKLVLLACLRTANSLLRHYRLLGRAQ